MKKICLGWGEPVACREVLSQIYRPPENLIKLKTMEYAPDGGDPELIEEIQEYLMRTVGRTYKHIIITNGTTPAINVVLRTFKRYDGITSVSTNKNYFPFYPEMIEKNGLIHKKQHNGNGFDSIKLIDMPSNPTGNMSQAWFGDKTVWDSVYYNRVFINSPMLAIRPHRVNVGSLSKVFGLTGLRIGYIATDSDLDYIRFAKENLHETCSVSVPSQEIAKHLLQHIDYESFFRRANMAINYNRDSLDEISYLFDGQAVQKNGMFYATYADNKALEIVDKALVNYVVLSDKGQDRFVRFNLGQNNELTKKAVKQILRMDRV